MMDTSYENYLVGVGRQIHAYPEWRLGQAYFNALFDHRPELANSIRGTVIDPFHSDAIIPEFIEHVRKEWNR